MRKGFSLILVILIVVVVLIIGIGGYFYFATENVPMCGGIAGLKCPQGYSCEGVAKYPDAAGRCVPGLGSWLK